jgi:hypothetical protein
MKDTRNSRDFAGIALRVVETAIGERMDGSPLPATKGRAKDPKAVIRGRSGGLKGGKARAMALSPKRRKTIALRAAKARWKK